MIKQMVIRTCVAFTIFTSISGLIELSSGEMTTRYDDLFFRLVLFFIGFSTATLFQILDHLPLRFVQLVHYTVSLFLVLIVIWIWEGPFIINKEFYLNMIVNYSIIYVIIAFIYEIKSRKDIKKYNHLIATINRQ